MVKTKEELREARKQWFAPMEQKLKEMHTKEDDSLFYYHSSEDRIVLSHAMFWTMTQLQFFKSKMRKEKLPTVTTFSPRDSLSELSFPLGLPKEFFLLLRQYEEEMLDVFLQDDDYESPHYSRPFTGGTLNVRDAAHNLGCFTFEIRKGC